MNKLNMFGLGRLLSSLAVAALLAGCQSTSTQQSEEITVSVDLPDATTPESANSVSKIAEGSNLDREKTAEDWPAKDVPQVLSAFDATIIYPLPLWYDPESKYTAKEQIGVSHEGTEGIGFQRNYFPIVDGKVRADQVYVVRLLNIKKVMMPLLVMWNDSKAHHILRNEFVNNCDGKFHSYGPSNPKNTTVFFCEKVLENGREGAESAKSEIAVARLFTTNDVLITLFHAWNRNQFDYLDENTWPVSQEEIDEVIEMFGTVEMIPFGLPVKVN